MTTTKHILLFGAGKSATVLIEYLGKICLQKQWSCLIADADEQLLKMKTASMPHLQVQLILIEAEDQRRTLIAAADVVISMLPPALHILVAKDCLLLRKHLLTASYIDPAIRVLENEIEAAGLLFLGEMGLDPGIDHMSAMKIIHSIKEKGGEIHSFKSHCGGLVAQESDTNPWHYKISWNPRNIVTAGKAGAIYKLINSIKKINYQQIFKDCELVKIDGIGELAFYPNRDSLSYIPLYGLETAETFIRTTLRYPSFCAGWQKIIEARLTDDNLMIDTDHLSYGRFLREQLAQYHVQLDTPTLEQQFEMLGLYNNHSINKGIQSAAAILQDIIEEQWVLEQHDKDMIVMLHEIDYTLNNCKHGIKSSLIVKGDDSLRTAMAKTVGLPLGIAATLLLENKIDLSGLHIPTIPAIYLPVLNELANEGIQFEEVDAHA